MNHPSKRDVGPQSPFQKLGKLPVDCSLEDPDSDSDSDHYLGHRLLYLYGLRTGSDVIPLAAQLTSEYNVFTQISPFRFLSPFRKSCVVLLSENL